MAKYKKIRKFKYEKKNKWDKTCEYLTVYEGKTKLRILESTKRCKKKCKRKNTYRVYKLKAKGKVL